MAERDRHRLNILWVAIAALLGICSLSESAMACGDGSMRACCTPGGSSGCGGCCSTKPQAEATSGPTMPNGVEHANERSGEVVESLRPATACECGTHAPAFPASKPDPKAGEVRELEAGSLHVFAMVRTPANRSQASKLAAVVAESAVPRSVYLLNCRFNC